MKTSPLRLLALWLCLLVTLGSCSADSPAPEGWGGSPSAPREEPQGGSAMTASLKMAVLRARQKAAGYAFASDASGTLRARAGDQGATAEVLATARGVRLSRPEGGGFELGIETTSVGRDGSPGSRGVQDQHAEGQELVQGREDGVEERYLAGPLGLEQSYVVDARPAGSGPLAIEVAFTGLTPGLAGGAPSRVLLRDEAGRVRAGYRDLVAVDAEGRELEARMDVGEAGVTLVVDDTGAVYPLRVDPLVWIQQAELTASDGAAYDGFGWSVAVSGGTAVVGAYEHSFGSNAYQGAAYVFVQSGTTWTQQAELTASDGRQSDLFGSSVAVSGGTVVVGAPQHTFGINTSQGAAYVFVQSGTTWTQQQELMASDGAENDVFGASVAVSGGTAVVGAFNAFNNPNMGLQSGRGAAYVFVQSGTTWTLQQELTASDGAAFDHFGSSVAVSGGTAFVGAAWKQFGSTFDQGAAYVFTQSGTTWTQQQELTASDGAAGDYFGVSVAVSGGTAVVGAHGHQVGANAVQGAAYVFVQSGTTWTLQQELTASDGAAFDHFGWSVVVNGGTALVGAQGHQVGASADQGAAYVFVQSGTTWTQQQELTASDGAENDGFGYSVALSGGTAVVGADNHKVGSNAGQGAAYVFAPTFVADCFIGGTLFPPGTINPANPCQVCALATSATTWSNEPDGTGCASGEVCSSGTCVADCFLGGVLIPAGTVDPANPCQVCTPATSTTAWSSDPDGTACASGEVCSSGTCVADCFLGGTLFPAGTVESGEPLPGLCPGHLDDDLVHRAQRHGLRVGRGVQQRDLRRGLLPRGRPHPGGHGRPGERLPGLHAGHLDDDLDH